MTKEPKAYDYIRKTNGIVEIVKLSEASTEKCVFQFNSYNSLFEIPTFNVDNSIVEEITEGKLEAVEKLKKAYVKYLQNELAREDLK